MTGLDLVLDRDLAPEDVVAHVHVADLTVEAAPGPIARVPEGNLVPEASRLAVGQTADPGLDPGLNNQWLQT